MRQREHQRPAAAHQTSMTTATQAAPLMSVPSLTVTEAWDLLMTVTDDQPVIVDVDGTPLTISVVHVRTYEPSMGPHPFGVLFLPIGVGSNQAQPLVSGTLTVSYGPVTREVTWKPGFVSDARWDAAELIERMVNES